MKHKELLLFCTALLVSCGGQNTTEQNSVDSTPKQETTVETTLEDSTSEEGTTISEDTTTGEETTVEDSTIDPISIEDSTVDSASEDTSTSESTSSDVEEDPTFDFQYKLFDTLPEISITTETNNDFATVPDKNNKWDYTDAKISVKNCPDEFVLTDIAAGIKVRGNYTANYSKKPFRIKFNKKQTMLGLNDGLKAKSWVLLADVKDASMLHNAYSFYLGNQMLGQQGLYSSDFTPVSLTINEQYWGMYLLCEQQQVGKSRVEVTDVEDLDDEAGNHYLGNDIGYFFEYDGYYYEEGATGDPTFTITYENNGNVPTFNGGWVRCSQNGYTIKSTIYDDGQRQYIQKVLQNIYSVAYSAIVDEKIKILDSTYENFVTGLAKDPEALVARYVDIPSLVDMYILQEISCDADIGWSSFYLSLDMAKDGTKKLTFQAPWDYDSAYGIKNGIVNNGKGYYAATSGNPWLSLFMNASWFRDRVKNRWKQLVNGGVFDTGFAMLDEYSNKFENEYARNFTRWPNSIGRNNQASGELTYTVNSYTTQRQLKDYLSRWLHTRLDFLTNEFYPEGATNSEEETYDITGKTKTIYEAENATLENGGAIRSGNGASNNGYIGQLDGNANIQMSFKVTSPSDGKAILAYQLSQREEDRDIFDMFSLTVNDVNIEGKSAILEGVGNEFNWHNWKEVLVCEIDLKEGENSIVLTTSNSSTNFDYIALYAEVALS